MPVALLVGALALASWDYPTAVAGPARGPSTGEPPPGSVHVQVTDQFFTPFTVPIKRGGTVVFDFVGFDHHTATDATGMQLYDSDLRDEGDPAFWYTFPAAGVYRFVCTPHVESMSGRVVIPMRVAPRRGTTSTTFTVTWAAAVADAGFVYDVQIKRPGTSWNMWLAGETSRTASFTPRAGEGTYRFRARMRSLTEGRAKWSAAAVARVG